MGCWVDGNFGIFNFLLKPPQPLTWLFFAVIPYPIVSLPGGGVGGLPGGDGGLPGGGLPLPSQGRPLPCEQNDTRL